MIDSNDSYNADLVISTTGTKALAMHLLILFQNTSPNQYNQFKK